MTGSFTTVSSVVDAASGVRARERCDESTVQAATTSEAFSNHGYVRLSVEGEDPEYPAMDCHFTLPKSPGAIMGRISVVVRCLSR